MKSTLKPLVALAASVAFALSASASAAQPAAVGVTIERFAFGPAELTVAAGTTVTWANQDAAPHTTTADTGAWDSDVLSTGRSFAFMFTGPGDFTYHCDIHPDMLGVIHVVSEARALDEEPAIDEALGEAPAPAVEPAPAEPATSSWGY